MLVFCMRHLWILDLLAGLYTSSHWWIVSFKCAILADKCGWVGEGTSFRACRMVLMVFESGLMRGQVMTKKVCRTSLCHSASSPPYTRFLHPLPRDSHRP